jgi:hypothetical protein
MSINFGKEHTIQFPEAGTQPPKDKK